MGEEYKTKLEIESDKALPKLNTKEFVKDLMKLIGA